MKKIVCLGSSHTVGGWAGGNDEFEKSWPGILHNYLNANGLEADIINGGECGFSVDLYPTKVLNFYNKYKPDLFLIEYNHTGKIDLEIGSDLTGESVADDPDYDPIFSRQRISSENGVIDNECWPNRKTVSNSEAIHYYNAYHKMTKQQIEEMHGENLPPAIVKLFAEESYLGTLSEYEKDNATNKLDTILKSMGPNKKNAEILINHIYYRAVYESGSDAYAASYIQNIWNIVATCRLLGIDVKFFTMHNKIWTDNQVYKDTYQELLKNNWLFDNINFALRPWFKKHYGKEFKKAMGDSIHFYDWAYKAWIDEMLGQEVIQLLNRK